jgi:hypothetical protein
MKLDLEAILTMWREDSEISEFNLDEESRKTPSLHAKYLEIYSLTKLRLKKAELDQKTLLKDKWLYYNGKMDEQTIQEKGWDFDPFNGLRVLKGDMDHYYDADTDIQASEEKITYYKTIISTLDEIINNLRWRHSIIKNMIDWRRFESGG